MHNHVEQFAEDHRHLLEAAARVAGLKAPVAVQADVFGIPLLKAARRGALVPIDGVLVRVKTPGRIVLTCDASPLAGLPPGVYEEWGQKFEVRPEGKVVVPGTTYLAGSACFTDTCVRLVMRYAGVSLAEAVDMAGQRPRHLLGLPARSLAPGEPADLVLFEHGSGAEFRVSAVVVGGRRVTA